MARKKRRRVAAKKSEGVDVADYQVLDCMATGTASYAPGQTYVLDKARGDKWVERGLAKRVSDHYKGHPSDLVKEHE